MADPSEMRAGIRAILALEETRFAALEGLEKAAKEWARQKDYDGYDSTACWEKLEELKVASIAFEAADRESRGSG